jgi:tetratricopeptide (TPR) repeat protein
MTKEIKQLITAFLLAASIVFAQDVEMNPEAAKLYNEGNQLVKSGQYESALDKYTSAQKIENHPNILYQKSVAFKKLRKFDEAEEALKECVKIDPKFTPAYTGLGTTYYSLKNFQGAIKNFEKFIELSSDEKQNKKIREYIGLAYTQLGQKAKTDGKHDLAITNLKAAVQNYDYDAAYLYLAEVYLELNNFDGALEAADKAINYRTGKSKISKGAPYFYKGLAFKGKNEIEKAKENFKRALDDSQYRANAQHYLKALSE